MSTPHRSRPGWRGTACCDGPPTGACYPQLYNIDLRESVERLDVPLYVLDGAAELEGRRALLLEWFEQVEAPIKLLVTFENAAHSVAFEQADEVQRLFADTILPATYNQ